MVEALAPSDLWAAMCRAYAMPGIAQACLELQGRYELDVPLFLAVLQAVKKGSRIDIDAIRSLDELCGQWRMEVVRPLRAIRVRLKANPWMESHTPAVPFRSTLKALELDAEKLQVAVLDEAIAGLPLDEIHEDKRTRIGIAAHMVLEHFAGRTLPEKVPQADLIADAVWSLARD